MSHRAVEVVVEGLEIRVALPRVAALVLRRVLQPVLEKTQRIAVPGGDFHLRAQREMVEVEHPAHVVVRDRRVRARADRRHLARVEPSHLVGGEAAEIERVGGFGSVTVRFGRSIWSKLSYSIDQNTLPQARLSASVLW
jgi:hypothetical protein